MGSIRKTGPCPAEKGTPEEYGAYHDSWYADIGRHQLFPEPGSIGSKQNTADYYRRLITNKVQLRRVMSAVRCSALLGGLF